MKSVALTLALIALGLLSLVVHGSIPENKVASDLALAIQQYNAEMAARAGARSEHTVVEVFADISVLSLDVQGRAQIYLDVDKIDSDLLMKLERGGIVIEQIAEEIKVLQVRVSVTEIENVVAIPAVRRARLVELGYVNAGTVQSEGDAVIRADRVRKELKITGGGIRVGVLADGVSGLEASIIRGDLPQTGVTCLSFRADSNIGAGSEGTAILEIIHDIAPDARLFFANFQTSVEFMAAQNWLADRTDIVIDSVSFFNNGSYDGTGPISTHTAAIVGRGIPYITAVGNYADKHYQGLFRDTNGNSFHEFGQSSNAGETLNFTLFPNSNVTVYLQWDDRFGASANNYDLYLTDPNDPSIIINNLSSRNVQDGRGDPVESIAINYTGSVPVTYGIAIKKVGNAASKNLELFFVGTRFQLDEFIVPDSSVPNNGDAAGGVLAIGAMDFRSSSDIEIFSSRGPTNDGRLKPDFVAPDGVSTAAPGYASFFGTSAAAAHAAGVAALILSASPNIAPAQVTGFLRGGAVAMSSLGPDNLFGFGRIDAFQPVQTLVNLPPPTFFSMIDAPRTASQAQEQQAALSANRPGGFYINSSFEVVGWAIASRGIQKVEIVLDGVVISRATYGLPRRDVCVVYANYPGCPNVGFVAPLTGISPGNHTLALRLTDNTGNTSIQPKFPLNLTVDASSITAFIDNPTADATVGSNFIVRGWAVSDLGIRRVELFLDGLLARVADYGSSRQDVCNVFPTSLGCPNVGFSGELLDVPAGFHQLMVRFTDNSGGMTQILRNVTVAASQIRIFIDEPAPGASLSGSFRVSGWGIATQSVTRVEILVDNTFIANATYGSARPDVCQVFPGFPQCPNVGFVANLSGIPAGQHTIVARVVDGSGGSNSTSIAITVTGGGGGGGGTSVIQGFIDSPTGGTVAPVFDVTGWALATQGVKRVEILLDGAVATVATYGLSRPDVCATLTGFANCPNVGFTGSVTATAGSHTLRIRIVDNSDATGTFPDTPIAFVVSAPSAVNVPAGSYNGTTSQRRPILIRLKAPNVIDQYGLLLQGTCQMDEVSAISASPINIINGSFSASGGAYFFNDPSQATQGTYTISGTFNPATSAFSGTFRIDMTTGTFGACTSGQITWTASSSSVP